MRTPLAPTRRPRVALVLPLLVSLMLTAGAAAWQKDSGDDVVIPEPQREFRGVWVATVANIDWPSKPGLSTEQQKTELLAILDRCVALNLNAVVLQVRPACDALYASSLEPWSEFLTGEMGRAPEPFYDPLTFAVEEAHRRGLELHTWFNPYRARHFEGKSAISRDHISRTHPELVRQYGRYMWLDPGEPEVQNHSLRVFRDVVRRYDVDGVHIDDYFYPYKENDAAGKPIPFPDDPSWQRYVKSGGKLGRDDWRRQNVDLFIERLYRTIKEEKSWVKVGISPFGIWRPGYPAQIKGFDQYAELYADARKWLLNGWVDYFTPQLYWRIDPPDQSYPVLLKWWSEQNPKGRHLWPGNYTSRAGGAGAWPPEELVNQIAVTRRQPGATGNVHFSMKSLMPANSPLPQRLAAESYAEPALVPASPWLHDQAPRKPRLHVRRDREGGPLVLGWRPGGSERPWLWVVQCRAGGQWRTDILPGDRTSLSLDAKDTVDVVAVSAVDRLGNKSRPGYLLSGDW